MNYKKTYRKLIAKARNRMLQEYTESHHVLPKALGGSDDPKNLVDLTAREHFIAHLLLAKMYPDSGMIHALWRMSNIRRYNSKDYSRLRTHHAKRIGAIASKALTGRKRSESHQQNWYDSRKQTGWSASKNQRKVASENAKGHRNPMWGKDHSEEAKAKIREANSKKVNCPHCKKLGGIAIMKRWHFDNCKQQGRPVAH